MFFGGIKHRTWNPSRGGWGGLRVKCTLICVLVFKVVLIKGLIKRGAASPDQSNFLWWFQAWGTKMILYTLIVVYFLSILTPTASELWPWLKRSSHDPVASFVVRRDAPAGGPPWSSAGAQVIPLTQRSSRWARRRRASSSRSSAEGRGGGPSIPTPPPPPPLPRLSSLLPPGDLRVTLRLDWAFETLSSFWKELTQGDQRPGTSRMVQIQLLGLDGSGGPSGGWSGGGGGWSIPSVFRNNPEDVNRYFRSVVGGLSCVGLRVSIRSPPPSPPLSFSFQRVSWRGSAHLYRPWVLLLGAIAGFTDSSRRPRCSEPHLVGFVSGKKKKKKRTCKLLFKGDGHNLLLGLWFFTS